MYDAIAIPSSNRAERLATTTLPLLLHGGVAPEKITVFIPDMAQAESYIARLGRSGVQFSVGHGLGMRTAREAIRRAYPVGTRLVQIDDDITGLFRYVDEKTLEPVTDVDAEFAACSAEAGGSLWCWYPVPNPFFMGERVRRGGLWYAEGCLFGYTVRGDEEREQVLLDDKEDFERSCRFFMADGEVVRFDNRTFRSKFYKEPGGMQDYRTSETVRLGAQRLAEMFPDLATAYLAKSGRWEVRLKDRRGR